MPWSWFATIVQVDCSSASRAQCVAAHNVAPLVADTSTLYEPHTCLTLHIAAPHTCTYPTCTSSVKCCVLLSIMCTHTNCNSNGYASMRQLAASRRCVYAVTADTGALDDCRVQYDYRSGPTEGRGLQVPLRCVQSTGYLQCGFLASIQWYCWQHGSISASAQRYACVEAA